MKVRSWVLFLLFPLMFYLAYRVDRTDFVPFILLYGAVFLLSLYLVWGKTALPARQGVYAGLALRAMLLFSIPNLSDDVFRFLWDGRLLAAGVHPFAMTPEELMRLQHLPEGINLHLFSLLNSKAYHTVYPPLNQVIFALGGWLFPKGLLGGIVLIKLFLLASEAGVLYLLAKWHSGESRYNPALLYALNPLAILEISGNCHFEGMLLLFLLLGIRALEQQRNDRAALFWAFGTATKLLPLLFLPLVWRFLGWKKGWRFMLVFGGLCLLLFAPLFNLEIVRNMASSLDLYFQKFAFNASFFYVFWEIGMAIGNYPLDKFLGPMMAPIVLLGILWLAWKRQKTGGALPDLQENMVWAAVVYLLFASTVHPWYILLPFGLAMPNMRREYEFLLVWTGLAALSYSHYADGAFRENYALIAVEYLGVLGWLGWRLKPPASTVASR